MTKQQITCEDCDRLLGLGDQFLEDWEGDHHVFPNGNYPERKAEWDTARPLMAAAPDLLAALEYAADVLQDHVQYDSDDDDVSAETVAFNLARAAIAKARGEG